MTRVGPPAPRWHARQPGRPESDPRASIRDLDGAGARHRPRPRALGAGTRLHAPPARRPRGAPAGRRPSRHRLRARARAGEIPPRVADAGADVGRDPGPAGHGHAAAHRRRLDRLCLPRGAAGRRRPGHGRSARRTPRGRVRRARRHPSPRSHADRPRLLAAVAHAGDQPRTRVGHQRRRARCRRGRHRQRPRDGQRRAAIPALLRRPSPGDQRALRAEHGHRVQQPARRAVRLHVRGHPPLRHGRSWHARDGHGRPVGQCRKRRGRGLQRAPHADQGVPQRVGSPVLLRRRRGDHAPSGIRGRCLLRVRRGAGDPLRGRQRREGVEPEPRRHGTLLGHAERAAVRRLARRLRLGLGRQPLRGGQPPRVPGRRTPATSAA